MALFSDAGVELLLRWPLFLAGITWIGLLYYFKFVQGPFFAAAAAAGRRAFLASRTNVVFSVPMLFFMGAATHLPPSQVTHPNSYWLGLLVVAGLVELNALTATSGLTTKPIEKISGVITTGFVVWAIVYGLVRFWLVG